MWYLEILQYYIILVGIRVEKIYFFYLIMQLGLSGIMNIIKNVRVFGIYIEMYVYN